VDSLETAITSFVEKLEKMDTWFRNRVAVSTGLWSRYSAFLEEILHRYEAAGAEYIKASDNLWGNSKQIGFTAIQELTQRGYLVHLEIESFYLFAKILLDRVADMVAEYFGIRWVSAGSSHAELARRFDELCAAADLDGASIRPMLEDLQERVIRPRNKMIEHLTDPRRLRTVSIDMRAGKVGLSTAGMILPEPGDMEGIKHSSSADLHDLYAALEAYLLAAIAFLDTNVTKSALLKPKVVEGKK
jgi:hypothetical protein